MRRPPVPERPRTSDTSNAMTPSTNRSPEPDRDLCQPDEEQHPPARSAGERHRDVNRPRQIAKAHRGCQGDEGVVRTDESEAPVTSAIT